MAPLTLSVTYIYFVSSMDRFQNSMDYSTYAINEQAGDLRGGDELLNLCWLHTTHIWIFFIKILQ
jgi:hypothetical protein